MYRVDPDHAHTDHLSYLCTSIEGIGHIIVNVKGVKCKSFLIGKFQIPPSLQNFSIWVWLPHTSCLIDFVALKAGFVTCFVGDVRERP